jgi:hypothetical protein
MTKVEEITNNIPLIIDKIEAIAKSNNTTSEVLLNEVVRFIDLIHLSNSKLSPSYLVDLAWHEFILFTKYYNTFCNKHYGRFIHHTPGKSTSPEIFKKTVNLYIKEYGLPTHNLWGKLTKNEWQESECGSCLN